MTTTSTQQIDPEIDTEIRREVTDRLVISMTRPHLQPALALRHQSDFARLIETDPTPWPLVWAAVMLHNVVGTLPEIDPWRRLVGRTGCIQIAAPDYAPPEGQNGAWTRAGDGRRFGSFGDSLDLARLDGDDLSRDPGLAAVADPLSPASAALIALAGHSPIAVLDALTEARDDLAILGPRCTAREILMTVDPALRWALARRAQYCGLDDPYGWVAAHAAQDVADRAVRSPARCAAGVRPADRHRDGWPDRPGRVSRAQQRGGGEGLNRPVHGSWQRADEHLAAAPRTLRAAPNSGGSP